ncbi:uncharacterized protein LOC119331679 [Triticum dicoccoides]|uniref:uncharacterized protein LOC119331679 n=1 Tax=Triticum dicoccoides TaxID=85692 RepID=UPI000E790C15|nr:uncharacterized protein LOC119331679 [Triticum dicoccoides]
MLSNAQSSSKLIDLEGYRTKSASLMKMEGITSGKKRKKTSIEQPLDPPAEKIHIRGDEKVEEAMLPDAREKKKFTPIRRQIKIQDLRRQIKLGTRSRFDAKEWICENCTWTNKPQKHLIAHLPPFFCENCQYDLLKMGNYEFSFSMADVTVNGFSPIGNIKDQGNTDHCTVYSTNQCLEITDRMSKILVGKEPEGVCNEGPILSTKDLLAKTEDMMIRCNINQRKGDHKFNRKTLVVAFEVAEAEGVNVVLTKVEQDNEMKPRTVKALGKQFVPCDFASIAQKLADGIPQVGSFLSGKKLYNLKHGQIYKAPGMPEDENHKKKVVWHAVVLIGAGKRRKKYFYHFVNSLGVKFCLRIPINPSPRPKSTWVGGVQCGKSKQFPGGFGKVRASDVMLDTLQFVRYPDSNTQKQPWLSFNYCAVR